MGKYTGAKCLSCQKAFTDRDDIVVCPDCGTPYHRACYEKEGKCINTQLHESGESWQRDREESNEENPGTLRCIRCGAENPADKLFCDQCGTPLIKYNAAQPRPFNNVENNMNGFNAQNQGMQQNLNGQNPYGFGTQQLVFDKDSQIDGIKLDDYAKYVRSNPLVFLSNFIKFGKFGTKFSINVAAFIFPEVYFLFRKMWKVGVAALVVTALLSVPNVIEYISSGYLGRKAISVGIDVTQEKFKAVATASWYMLLAIKFAAGFFGNYLYYKTAQKKIRKIREKDSTVSEEQIKEEISVKGGTSLAAVFIGYAAFTAIIVAAIFSISKFL